MTRKEVVQLGSRVAKAIAIPGDEALGRKSWTTRSRIRVDAQEENKDETTRERELLTTAWRAGEKMNR